MKPPTRTETPTRQSRKYPVFRADGSVFYSDEPAHNPETEWVWEIIRSIRNDYLTPLMVVVQHARLKAPLLHPDTVTTWGEMDRFHLWPMAGSNSSLERTIMQQGRQFPPWSDDNAWSHACNTAEKVYGHPSRFEGLDMSDPSKILRPFLKSISGLDDEAYDARIHAEAQRQLAAAKAAGLL